MNIDTTSNDFLVVRLEWWEQIASFHPGALDIPRDQVDRAHLDVPRHGWKRLRLPGAFVPGVVQTGTYLWVGRREFWLTHRWYRSRLVIELKPYARYDRLILGMDDAEAESQRINDWLAAGAKGDG